jgi:hypothetical protein
MEPIVFTEDDALNPRDKDRDIGEPGIACRHCKGRRSFPRGGELSKLLSLIVDSPSHSRLNQLRHCGRRHLRWHCFAIWQNVNNARRR